MECDEIPELAAPPEKGAGDGKLGTVHGTVDAGADPSGRK